MTINNYNFSILVDGNFSFTGYGFGENAVAAFESAIDDGSIMVPSGEFTVIAQKIGSRVALQFSGLAM